MRIDAGDKSYGWNIIWFLVLLTVLTWYNPATSAADDAGRRVLILNSYHPGMVFSDEEVRGIRSTLPETAEVFVEYMDSKRTSAPEYLELMARTYQLKYSGKRFDLVFSLDDDALRFLLQRHGQLFPETPVVFCGVNILSEGMLDNQTWFTGVVEAIDIEATIDLGMQLFPKTRQILAITDNTTSGRSNRAALEELSQSGRYSAKFVFLDPGNGLLLPELLQKLKESPRDSIVYHADFFQDRLGNSLNLENVMPQVSTHAPGPVFAHGAIYLGLGIVGGKLNSGFYQGQTAGLLAQRIWRGDRPSGIPVVREDVNRYMFDSKELDRWKIPPSALPPHAEIVNMETSFYERHRFYIWTVLCFVLAEAVIIALLGANISLRKRAGSCRFETTSPSCSARATARRSPKRTPRRWASGPSS